MRPWNSSHRRDRRHLNICSHWLSAFSKAQLRFPILFVKPPVYSRWYHRTVAYIAEHSLRSCQYHGAFIAPLPTEKSNILIVKSSLRHWLQAPNLFITPLQTAVCTEEKAPDGPLCTVDNLFPNSQQLYEMAQKLFQGALTGGVCRWFRFAQLAKGKKFRP
jgi:hypothetical protein